MPKVLLIQPSQYLYNGDLIKQKKLYLPGLVFPLLAAMAPKNWEIEVKIEIIEEIDFNSDADIVGLGSMGHSIYRAFDIAKEFKRRGKIVFIGGYMASMVPEIAMEFVDSVVIGDAEISFPKLLSDYERTGKISRVYDYPVKDLNDLPLPRYELLTSKSIGDMLPVQAARGCNHSCSYCSISCLYKGRYLTRPVESVIRDIEKIKSLGCRKFYMIDDNIVSNPAYLEELCRRIIPLKMKWSTQCTMNLARNKPLLELVARSGCEILSLGVETVTQEGVDRLNKKWLRVGDHVGLLSEFRKAGIMVSAEFMVGTDSDTVESLRATYNFISRCKIPLLRIYFLTPVPGTRLYTEYKNKGRLMHEDFSHYKTCECVHYPEKISPVELTRMYHWLNKKVFSVPGIISRTLLNNQILKHPGLYIFAFAVNLHYRSYVKRGETPLIV
jgi:radical SAM superfamily enzyme YgiQ (UPF0313 family)